MGDVINGHYLAPFFWRFKFLVIRKFILIHYVKNYCRSDPDIRIQDDEVKGSQSFIQWVETSQGEYVDRITITSESTMKAQSTAGRYGSMEPSWQR
jgi:hypothetical protein